MPLTPSIHKKDKSELIALWQTFLLHYLEKHKVLPHHDAALPLLMAIQRLASAENLALSKQPDNILKILFKSLLHYLTKVTDIETLLKDEDLLEISAESVMEPVRKTLDRHAQRNVRLSLAVGDYDSLPLYESEPYIELQDHHVTRLMPEGNAQFFILGAYRFGNRDHLKLTIATLKEMLHDPAKKVIILPIGPVHWRSLTFYRGEDGGLSCELFDSVGIKSAKKLASWLTRLLKKVGEPTMPRQYLGPVIKQKLSEDSYACGDFVVARAHQVAKHYNQHVARGHRVNFNQALVDVLSQQGNQLDALRQALVAYSIHQAEFDNLTRGVVFEQPARQERVESDWSTAIELSLT